MAFQNDSIFWVELEKIVPNPYQPRREFDQSRLEELAESIRMYGVLQPLTVTRREIQRENGAFHTEYELIAGERRLRASKLAGISLAPVIIRDGEQNEQEKLELAIIENLQREDLNAVDRALAFKQLADSFSLSHAQVARKVGRSREYVANSVRLLGLPEHMLTSLRTGDLSEGHARTLLMVNEKPEEQDTLYREILLKKLSVREVERIARSIATEKVRKRDKNYDPELVEMEKKFTETLGTRVHIQKTEFGGKVTIDYFSPEDLAYMLERMKQEANERAEGRRPFSPPGEMTNDTGPNDELTEVTDATPLSALIAKLQQVETGEDRYGAPAATPEPAASFEQPTEPTEPMEPTPTEPAPAPAPEVEQPRASYFADDTPVEPVATVQPEEAPTGRVTVITTNAPVSLVGHAPSRSYADVAARPTSVPSSAEPAPEPTPAPEVREPTGPRIVSILRDRTTAMYVATAAPPATPVENEPAQSATASAAPEDIASPSDPAPEPVDESHLYSIRNFNV